MKRKIKYLTAVAILMIATAFSACSGRDSEVYSLDELEEIDAQKINSAAASENGSGSQNQTEEQLNRENAADTAGQENQNESDTSGNSVSDQKVMSTIFVYICGAVKYPDVYELASSARVVDAIKAAGGLNGDAAEQYLNLAAGISDGQKIYVPTEREIEEAMQEGTALVGSVVNVSSNSPTGFLIESGEDAGDNSSAYSASSGNTADSDNSGKVNINTAGRDELMTLSGIGEAKADKIIAYRQENGAFSSIEDIMQIPGIKEGMFSKIKDSICVE